MFALRLPQGRIQSSLSLPIGQEGDHKVSWWNFMDDVQFWEVIERAKSDGPPEVTAERVYEQLTRLPPDEIESFGAILDSKVDAAFVWKLWGAAYLLNGGCSDDGFYYFRGWLIAQGQEAYEGALVDPDSLVRFADPEDDYHECEDLLYASMRAYESVTGQPLPVREGAISRTSEPSGDIWDFDDEDVTARHLPRLARACSQ